MNKSNAQATLYINFKKWTPLGLALYVSILVINLCLIQSELNGAKKGMNQL